MKSDNEIILCLLNININLLNSFFINIPYVYSNAVSELGCLPRSFRTRMFGYNFKIDFYIINLFNLSNYQYTRYL